MKMRRLIPLATAIFALAPAAAHAKYSLYHGCYPRVWGTIPCWDPNNPANTAALHPCPRFTIDRPDDLGDYYVALKIRSTIDCRSTDRLIKQGLNGGPWLRLRGWEWFGGGSVSTWQSKKPWPYGADAPFMNRTVAIARTNLFRPEGPLPLGRTMLERDIITYDSVMLVKCSAIYAADSYDRHRCKNITLSTYAGVPL